MKAKSGDLIISAEVLIAAVLVLILVAPRAALSQTHPTIVVENMQGAGSVIAANYMFKSARPDGLTIGHILGGLFLQQLLENPAIEFDGRKFEYIGVPAQDHFLIGLSKATGVMSFENWLASKKTVKLGGVAPGGATDDIPKVLEATLGLPIKVLIGSQKVWWIFTR